MKTIKKIIKQFLPKKVILYVIFGILTTVVNLGSFYAMHFIFGLDKNLSNSVAIILAVVFAYLTNRDLVFHSQAENISEKLKEFLIFIAGRVFTMIIEFLGGVLLFQTAIPEMISKIIVTVLVIILNFFISNFFVFKSK